MPGLLIFIFVAVALGVGVFAPLWDVKRTADARERAVTIRLTLFTWLLAGLMALALLLLPDKHRVLFLIPLLALTVVVGRIWKTARRRHRVKPGTDFERMKRAN